jgi:signal transduction histidine kinase
VSGSTRALRQVLINLLSNAVKFTFPGGTVSVDVTHLSGGTELVVTDTGIGIAPENLAVVTQPFRQVGDAFIRDRGGTGLGLAIVKGLMTAHGGGLRIESTVGVGTAVYLYFPDVAA